MIRPSLLQITTDQGEYLLESIDEPLAFPYISVQVFGGLFGLFVARRSVSLDMIKIGVPLLFSGDRRNYGIIKEIVAFDGSNSLIENWPEETNV